MRSRQGRCVRLAGSSAFPGKRNGEFRRRYRSHGKLTNEARDNLRQAYCRTMQTLNIRLLSSNADLMWVDVREEITKNCLFKNGRRGSKDARGYVLMLVAGKATSYYLRGCVSIMVTQDGCRRGTWRLLTAPKNKIKTVLEAQRKHHDKQRSRTSRQKKSPSIEANQKHKHPHQTSKKHQAAEQLGQTSLTNQSFFQSSTRPVGESNSRTKGFYLYSERKASFGKEV